jgi:hypothetical protein
VSRIDEDPPEIDIGFFPTGHWLIGMGHDRATSVQSAIGDAIFQITGKRFRDRRTAGTISVGADSGRTSPSIRSGENQTWYWSGGRD